MRRVCACQVWLASTSRRAVSPSRLASASSATRRARASASADASPGSTSSAVSSCRSTSPILVEARRHDAASHRHVLEELGGGAEERRAVGIANVRRDEHVTRREVGGSVLLRDDTRQHRLRAHAVPLEARHNLRARQAVADHQQPHALAPVGTPGQHAAEGFGAVPAAETADEPEHAPTLEPQAPADGAASTSGA